MLRKRQVLFEILLFVDFYKKLKSTLNHYLTWGFIYDGFESKLFESTVLLKCTIRSFTTVTFILFFFLYSTSYQLFCKSILFLGFLNDRFVLLNQLIHSHELEKNTLRYITKMSLWCD